MESAGEGGDDHRPLTRYERLVLRILLGMIHLIVALTVLALAYRLITDAVSSPVLLLDLGEVFDLLGWALVALIGLELGDSVRVWVEGDEAHVEVVILVALTAVVRKAIVPDKGADPLATLALAALTLALAGAYVLVQRYGGRRH